MHDAKGALVVDYSTMRSEGGGGSGDAASSPQCATAKAPLVGAVAGGHPAPSPSSVSREQEQPL
jgi:hypothetical protein